MKEQKKIWINEEKDKMRVPSGEKIMYKVMETRVEQQHKTESSNWRSDN